ncbi:MAG: GH3 auxin-responsive promoter family protein [Bacteroidetes bacterium]|nr:GH3 auxin-responsive promoter family protein [Bacteroidota bacterium]MCK4638452.1 GH3 auxin-responsive promoter family protein [Bacteroidales bacterium]
MPIFGSIIKKAYELRNLPVEKRSMFNPYKTQRKVLSKLLRKAQFTAFGEYYHFIKILHDKDFVTAFRESVPIHDYNSMFQRWWYRSLNGEAYVCWPGRVKYFALTSGTSDASSKHIPVTGDMIRAIRKTSIRQLVSTVRYDFPIEFYQKGILMLGGSTHLNYNGTYYEGDLSGISAGNLPFWFQHFYKPGRRISKERDWSTKLEEIVKSAKGWDIGVIVGVPAWIQIILEKIITHYNVKTIHDIWPNLSVYVHSGVAFDPYIKSFEKLFDHPVIYNESYLASEGYIAYQTRPKVKAMEMVLDNCLFYEFIPFNDNNFDTEGNLKVNPETLTIDQVEENKEYALLLTSCAGSWRYLIGDTIKFTSKKHHEIIITGRTKHFLSICGEHLSQENMNRAIKKLQDEFNIEIDEFTVAGIRYNSMFAHKWFLGTDDNINPQIARDKIDEYLKSLNDDYRVERIAAIKDVIVEIYPTKVFFEWMKIHGKEGGANKFPRVLKKEQLTEWEDFLDKYKL